MTSHEFTWIFLLGWTAIHFFMVGAEWAFVQRYLCVPSPRDARKSAILFGVLYLISPLFWMLPPMVYRVLHPEANPEQAYILAAWSVLPAGMLGLMVAAMFSATASMVSSQLNVFAGVLTHDIVLPRLRRVPDEATQVRIGRGMSLGLGVLIIAVGMAVPVLGGAEKVVLSITSLVVGPLLLPLVWALFSRKITATDLALTAGVCFGLGLLVRFGLSGDSWLSRQPVLEHLATFVRSQPRSVEAIVGVVLPALLMILAELSRKSEAPGTAPFRALASRPRPEEAPATVAELAQPARVVGWSCAVCAAGMVLLAVFDPSDRVLLLGCGGLMAALAVPALRFRPQP